MPFEYFIAARYLRSKKKHAFISFITILSVLGITIGVMALIIVIAVMSGAESDFKTRILGMDAHVLLMRYQGAFDEYLQITKDITNIDGVETASPYIYTQVMLRSSSRVAGVVLRGIDPDSTVLKIKNFSKANFHRALMPDNKKQTPGFEPGIILGKELASTLSVIKGDTVYIISPTGMLSPAGHLPAMKRFVVTDIFQSGMYEYDSSFALIHLQEAQKVLRMKGTVTGIGIRIADVYDAPSMAKKIADHLNRKYPGSFFVARNWIQMNHNLFSALKLEKKAMFIILTLIVLVAAFNIASTLIMMVMGKTRDIAILKAMGASNKSIKKIFIFKGLVIGSTGAALGTFFGFLGCFILKHYKFIELPGDVYYFTTLPVQLKILDVLIIVCSTMLICFLAAIYPATHASRLDPVEAIRYG